MKTTLSVKSFAGLDSERSIQSTFFLPDAALEALEKLSAQPLPEWASDPDIAKRTAELEARGELMAYSNFGRFLPKGFSRLADLANEELEAAAEERGWPVTAEERLAAKVSVIQRAKELEQWKETQRTALRAKHWEAIYVKGKGGTRRFYTRHEREHTVKQLQADGSYKWDNATVYELPPLMTEEVQLGKKRTWIKSSTATGSHEPSRYLFTAPDGRKVDLGKTDGKWKPVKRNGPDAAMQSIAKRLGLSLRGGAASILQEIVGRTDIVPAYTTFWFNEGWVTIISWQKNAKLTPSTYVETLDGSLKRTSKNHGTRLTVSDAEYAIISKPSISEDDKDGDDANGYAELDKAFEQGFERDRERYVVDADQFSDGLVLLEQIARHMDMHNEFLSGDAIWLRKEFEGATSELVGQMQRERRPLCRELRAIRREYRQLRAIHLVAPKGEQRATLGRELKRLVKSAYKLMRQIEALRTPVRDMMAQLQDATSYTVVNYEKHSVAFRNDAEANEAPKCHAMLCMRSERPARVFPVTTPAMHQQPKNEVVSPAKIVNEVERIVPTVNPLALLQNGLTRICKTPAGTYSTRMAAKPSKGHTTPKNANPRLQATLMRIIYGQSPVAA